LCYQNKTCAQEENYIKTIKACTEKEINETRFGYSSSAFSTLSYSKINFFTVPLLILIVYSLF